jgi:hypothetical protein
VAEAVEELEVEEAAQDTQPSPRPPIHPGRSASLVAAGAEAEVAAAVPLPMFRRTCREQ